mmetsp:Transcript_7522/g.14904  ORF Transcript_7522/g.14904 Transcript_7522/m.14904 type:complete len:90 (+) Transcript_7522:1354-1623(+)
MRHGSVRARKASQKQSHAHCLHAELEASFSKKLVQRLQLTGSLCQSPRKPQQQCYSRTDVVREQKVRQACLQRLTLHETYMRRLNNSSH